MDRYEVMAGKMAPLTDGAHRKWGFTGKVETRSYERLVDALIDFVETGDSLKARFHTGFAACLAADRKSVENRGFGVAVRKVRCHRGEDVADLPTIETAIPRLREIFAGADEVIGYNVGFDLGFLSAVGVRPREDARITDTMKEFTWFMGRRYKLVDAADHIGYEWTGRAHGSLADALATLAVQRWLEQWLVAE